MTNTIAVRRWKNVIIRTYQNPNINNGEAWEDVTIDSVVPHWSDTGIDLNVDNEGTCRCCGETKPVLIIGASGGEYEPAILCADCARDLINRKHLK